MSDELLLAIVYTLFFIVSGICLGFNLDVPSSQEVIDKFGKNPVCVEKKIGHGIIKRCYKIQVISEEFR